MPGLNPDARCGPRKAVSTFHIERLVSELELSMQDNAITFHRPSSAKRACKQCAKFLNPLADYGPVTSAVRREFAAFGDCKTRGCTLWTAAAHLALRCWE